MKLSSLILAIIGFCSCVIGGAEERQTPFDRVIKGPDGPPPPVDLPKRLQGLEFNGVFSQGGETTFSIFDPESKQSFWIPLHGTEEGISIFEFDAENDVLGVSIHGHKRDIDMVQNEIVALKVPRTSKRSGNGVNKAPKKPVVQKSKKVQQEEEEARMFVSDILEIGMQERAKRKAEREAKHEALRIRRAKAEAAEAARRQ